MKPIKILLFVALMVIANNLQAQNNYTLSTYTVTIDGTSNLHNWSEKVETVSGKGIVNWNADKTFTLKTFNIAMQVNSIKSDEGSVMNNKTYKALKADKFPVINFSLTEPFPTITTSLTPYSTTAKGNLTIAGVTKAITIPVKVSEDGYKKITVEGSQQIKESDYGVEAPTALFGMLKTGDVITINFKTTFLFVN